MVLRDVERKRDEGEEIMEGWESKDRVVQRGERWERIRGSKYNRWYGEVKGEGVPEYLRKGWGKVDGGGWRRLGWVAR